MRKPAKTPKKEAKIAMGGHSGLISRLLAYDSFKTALFWPLPGRIIRYAAVGKERTQDDAQWTRTSCRPHLRNPDPPGNQTLCLSPPQRAPKTVMARELLRNPSQSLSLLGPGIADNLASPREDGCLPSQGISSKIFSCNGYHRVLNCGQSRPENRYGRERSPWIPGDRTPRSRPGQSRLR